MIAPTGCILKSAFTYFLRANSRSIALSTTYDTALAQFIRRHRIISGVSQAQLARRLGITFQQVQKYERGTNRIHFGRFLEICDALGASPQDVIEEVLGCLDRPLPEPTRDDEETLQLVSAAYRTPERLRRPFAALMRAVGESNQSGV